MTAQLLTADWLNKIPLFNRSSLRRLEAELDGIAHIFTKHRMHNAWAIGYLHRHHQISDSCIWLHERDETQDLCLPCPINDLDLDPHTLNGHAYCLIDGKFLAYELDPPHINRPSFELEFLLELKQFLLERELEHDFSIVPRLDEVVLEMLLSTGGTIAVPYHIDVKYERHEELFDAELVDTEWRINSDISILGQRKCIEKTNGEHKVVN